MDRDLLKGLKQLWYNDVLWPNYVKFLEKEYEKCITECKIATSERAIGKLFFIKQLLDMQKNAKEAFKDEL
jgi:hypothetical protein